MVLQVVEVRSEAVGTGEYDHDETVPLVAVKQSVLTEPTDDGNTGVG